MLIVLIATPACAGAAAHNQDAAQADPRLLRVDREKREVRVRCQALRVEMPLEFFCVLAGTADHEAVLRTVVKPSAIHAALLGLDLEPGHPLRFEPDRKQWIAPTGPPLRIEVEWEQDGQTIRRRAGELMRNMKTGQIMPPGHWVFSGSALGPNGEYGADFTGQLVSIVNFEYTTIDVPRVASNANETLEWETNHERMPPEGTAVWMIITPVEAPATREAERVAEAARPQADAPVDLIVVMLDQGGGVLVNNEQVALGAAGAAVRARMSPASQVRLSAPRGAPVDDLGRLLAELVRAEITDITFISPPEAHAARLPGQQGVEDGAAEEPQAAARVVVEIHNGGREVSAAGRRMPVGTFVQELRDQSPLARGGGEEREPQRGYLIRPAQDADDLQPVDFAAVHAALYVLGFEVEVEAPGYGPPTQPAENTGADGGAAAAPADQKLAELRRRWEEQVLPQAASLQRAAQTHYEVIEAYQRQINRLLDEVERLRREMDLLQQRYNELTAPKPASQ